MQPVVARVFEITGAEAVFTVHDSLDAALAEDMAAVSGTLHSGHVVRVTTSVPKKWVFSPSGRAGDI